MQLWAQPQQVSIIPVPVEIQQTEGSFSIHPQTSIQFSAESKDLRKAALFLQKAIQHISGFSLPLQSFPLQKKVGQPIQPRVKNQSIELKLIKEEKIGNEGYHLQVSPHKVLIKANTKAGIIYGIQSLLQTLPAIRTQSKLEIPCMQVTDYPRFTWRGMHLDVSRHFFGPAVIKEYLDLLAAYKSILFIGIW